MGDPRDALTLVERPPVLPEIASVDWPGGRAIQVIAAGSDRLRVAVREGRGWFALDGSVCINGREVLELGH